MGYTDTVKDFEQCTTSLLPLWALLTLVNPSSALLHSPHSRSLFLDPMTSDGKISISVTCLPSITSNIDGTAHEIALLNN